MKSILLIANYKEGVGGISIQVELLEKHLLAEGYNVKIFGTKKTFFKRLFLPFLLFFEARNFDFFHMHGCSYFGFFPIALGVIVGKIFNKKTIVTYHGGDANDYFTKHPKFVKFFLKKTDVNIVLSGFLEKIFEKHSLPCVVIPNIIELDKKQFKYRQVIAPNYISVRTLSPLYNIPCILKAFSIVKKRYQNASLMILGDGIEKANLQNLSEELKLEQVQFVGKIPNSEIYNYLNKADILVSSPLIDNQPVSILEAFNAGLLVISSRVGGVPYMISDNETGLLFESNNEVELAKKMIEAVEDQNKSLKIIKNAKNKCSYYSWEYVRNLIISIYQ